MDNQAIIKRFLEEHQNIKGDLKLFGDSVNDTEVMLGLEKARSDWTPAQLGAVAKKQERLQETLSLVDRGIRHHFTFEEELLGPLVGEVIMRALTLEHEEIAKEIDEAKLLLAESKLEVLNQEELLSKGGHLKKALELLSEESRIKQAFNNISVLVGKHAAKESEILEMVRRGLEETS